MTKKQFETAYRIAKDIEKLKELMPDKLHLFLLSETQNDFKIWIEQEEKKLRKLLEEL